MDFKFFLRHINRLKIIEMRIIIAMLYEPIMVFKDLEVFFPFDLECI